MAASPGGIRASGPAAALGCSQANARTCLPRLVGTGQAVRLGGSDGASSSDAVTSTEQVNLHSLAVSANR
jgi:hypothetical protein